MSNPQKKRIHEGNKFYTDFTTATIPPLLMGLFYFGPRVLLLALIAVFTALITDRVSATMRGQKYDQTENSSIVIAMTLVLLMPASVPYHILVMAVALGVLVGKHAFGGYRNYPFNPVAVGYCMVAVSWPEQLFRYPAPLVWYQIKNLTGSQVLQLWSLKDATLAQGVSAQLRSGAVPKTELWNMLLGDVAGPLGTTACIVLLACGIFLVSKKRAVLSSSLVFIGTIALAAFLLPRAPEGAWKVALWANIPQRLQITAYEVMGGATIFGAVFLLNEPETMPKTRPSRLIYSVMLGLGTVVFRYFGAYELGICFAFLLINAVSGYFDRLLAGFQAKRKGVSKA